MATAKPNSSTPPARNLRRISRRWLIWAGLLVAIFLGYFWGTIHSYAVTGASYAARVACSCRFAGGRNLNDCRKDFEPGMGMVMLSEDTQNRSVTARFLLLSSQTATYREGQGCVLEPWKN